MRRSILCILISCFWAMTASFAQTDPSTLPSLELWVNADEGVDFFGASVLNWFDQSENENHLVQLATNRRPVLSEELINGRRAMRFDGSNDYMDFTNPIDNIRTVFWVISEDEDAAQTFKCLLGHSDSFHFLRGDEGRLWNSEFAHPGIQNGETRINGESFPAFEEALTAGFKVISLQTTEPVEANRFSRDRTFNATVWDGELAQLLIFSSALTEEEVLGVEQFLFEYYTEPLDLGEDIIIEDSFCDTTLIATGGYTNYLWSDGSNNDSLIVDQSGIYWVDATDVFGRVVRDSVLVDFPGNFDPGDALLCSGESFTWNLGLDPVQYDITWQDGSSDAIYTVSEDSLLSVVVSDDFGCSFESNPVQVSLDDFANEVSLGEDDSFCIGESIEILGGDFPGLLYNWSDGTNSSELTYNGQNQVWVQVTNANNCIATDTIQTSSLGNAPEVTYDFSGFCEGEPTLFADQSTGDAEIIEWSWTFDDLEFGAGEETSFIFPESGTYIVELNVSDANGCSSSDDQIVEINSLPEAAIGVDLICVGSEADLFDESTTAEGNIVAWNWTYAGGSSEGQEPNIIFNEPGFQNVELEVTTTAGCSDIASQLVEVSPIPFVDITVDGSCFGEFSFFSYDYQDNGAGQASTQNWQFGDGINSLQVSPQHFYQLPNEYSVALMVEAENGCLTTDSLNLQIEAAPIAEIGNLEFCEGQATAAVDLSQSTGSDIVEWTWTSDELGEFNGPAPVLTFEETGSYTLSLSVSTQSGCRDEVIEEVIVLPRPILYVDFDPEIGLPPLEVTFTGTTDLESSINWSFPDDGNQLMGDEVSYTFENEGDQTVIATAISSGGCLSDQVILTVPVTEPITELVLLDVYEEEGITKALISNDGNYSLSSIQLSQRLIDGNPSVETWNGELEPGDIILYEFGAALEPLGRLSDVLCVEVLPLNTIVPEEDLSNNEDCIAGETIEAQLYPPYPNPSSGELVLHASLPADEVFSMSLYSSIGQEVWNSGELAGIDGYNRVTADLRFLRPGIYILKMRFREKEYTTRLMRE